MHQEFTSLLPWHLHYTKKVHRVIHLLDKFCFENQLLKKKKKIQIEVIFHLLGGTDYRPRLILDVKNLPADVEIICSILIAILHLKKLRKQFHFQTYR